MHRVLAACGAVMGKRRGMRESGLGGRNRQSVDVEPGKTVSWRQLRAVGASRICGTCL